MHEEFVKMAIQMIADDGRSIVLVGTEQSGPAWNPEIVEKRVQVKAFEFGFEEDDYNGELIKHGDIRFLIDARVKPTADMLIRDYDNPVSTDILPLGQWRAGIDPYTTDTGLNGPYTDYSIVSINRTYPGETRVMYELHARI